MNLFFWKKRKQTPKHPIIDREHLVRQKAFAKQLSADNITHLDANQSIRIKYKSNNLNFVDKIKHEKPIELIQLKNENLNDRDRARLQALIKSLQRDHYNFLHPGVVVQISYRFNHKRYTEYVCVDHHLEIIPLTKQDRLPLKQKQQNHIRLNQIAEKLSSKNIAELNPYIPVEVNFSDENKNYVTTVCVDKPIKFAKFPNVKLDEKQQALSLMDPQDAVRLKALMKHMSANYIHYVPQNAPIEISYRYGKKKYREFVCFDQGIVRYKSRDTIHDRFATRIENDSKRKQGGYGFVKDVPLYIKLDNCDRLEIQPAKKVIKEMLEDNPTTLYSSRRMDLEVETGLFQDAHHGKAHAVYDDNPLIDTVHHRFIIMQKIKGDPINTIDFTEFSLQKRICAAIAVMDCIQRLHEKGIYHRDIKPTHIYLDRKTMRAYAIDFGLSHHENKFVPPQAMIGTPTFMPREAFKSTLSQKQLPGVDAFASSSCLGMIFARTEDEKDAVLKNRHEAQKTWNDVYDKLSTAITAHNLALKNSNGNLKQHKSEIESLTPIEKSLFTQFVDKAFEFPKLAKNESGEAEDHVNEHHRTIEDIMAGLGDTDCDSRKTLTDALNEMQVVRNNLLTQVDPELVAIDAALANAIKRLDSYETTSKKGKSILIIIEKLSTIRGQLGEEIKTADTARVKALKVLDEKTLSGFVKHRLWSGFLSDKSLGLIPKKALQTARCSESTVKFGLFKPKSLSLALEARDIIKNPAPCA